MKIYNIKYIIKQGKHVATYRPLKAWFNKKEFEISIVIERGWYKQNELNNVDGISKFRGVAFGTHAEKPLGKIWPFKYLVNSIIIGGKAVEPKGRWDIYIITDNRGVEKRYKIGSVMEGEKVTYTILRYKYKAVVIKDGVRIIYPLLGLPFGYYLNSYFGGYSTAVRTTVINTQLIAK